MKTKAQILTRIRELEKEMDESDWIDDQIKLRTYYMNLGRVKALNWCINKD